MILEPTIAIGEERSRAVWKTANEFCQGFQECYSKGNDKINRRARSQIGQLCWTNIQAHSVLGTGAFSDVYKVEVDHPDYDAGFYALKCMNGMSIRNFDQDYVPNAANLALESTILSSIEHENIICLHGVNSASDPQASRGHFLVLELLKETLTERLERLRESRNIFTTLKGASSTLERLQSCALGISRAMTYLHGKDVIIRDLKPANVGFDSCGTVKLFDFGLARHVDNCEHAIAGSLRYMAPETVLGRGSDKRSDVYSFGVLLYEIVTLHKPFRQYRKKGVFIEKVVQEKCRPSTKSIPSRVLSDLIRACWDHEPEKRPSFEEIEVRLKEAVLELTAKPVDDTGSMNGINDRKTQRKSASTSLRLSRALSLLPTEIFDSAMEDDLQEPTQRPPCRRSLFHRRYSGMKSQSFHSDAGSISESCASRSSTRSFRSFKISLPRRIATRGSRQVST